MTAFIGWAVSPFAFLPVGLIVPTSGEFWLLATGVVAGVSTAYALRGVLLRKRILSIATIITGWMVAFPTTIYLLLNEPHVPAKFGVAACIGALGVAAAAMFNGHSGSRVLRVMTAWVVVAWPLLSMWWRMFSYLESSSNPILPIGVTILAFGSTGLLGSLTSIRLLKPLNSA
jgi:hypothetical protein